MAEKVTYSENIEWHLCIDSMPEKKGKYLVAYDLKHHNQRTVKVMVNTYSGAAWAKRKKRMIAWAEMPTGLRAEVFFLARTIGADYKFGGTKK